VRPIEVRIPELSGTAGDRRRSLLRGYRRHRDMERADLVMLARLKTD
jgi:hypothetical protein